MSTTPPAPAPEPHKARQVAESFGADAGRYDRSRPRYPKAMVDALVSATPGREYLDVGTGTGVAARQFRDAGCTVLGVEVDARMAELAREAGLTVEVAKFEDWDAAGRSFDAVVAGQAWHWVDPVAGAAKAASVLRRGGRFAAFWNVFQPSPEMAAAFAGVYRRAAPDLPFNPWARPALEAYSAILAKSADGLREVGEFGEAEQWRFEWEHAYASEEWLNQVPTFGGHNRLPPTQLEELLAGLGAAIDEAGGIFTGTYTTVVLTAARR